MATRTATAAQTGGGIKTHSGTFFHGKVSPGCLSPSASAVLLVAEIPNGARNIRFAWSAIHTGATGAKLQAGIVRNGSVTASALYSLTDIAVTSRTAWQDSMTTPYDPNWDDYTGGPAYIQVSNGSGTISAGFVLDYRVEYDFYDL